MSRVDPDISSEDAIDALLAFARLLGRLAAEEAVRQFTVDHPSSLPQQKGACDDEK